MRPRHPHLDLDAIPRLVVRNAYFRGSDLPAVREDAHVDLVSIPGADHRLAIIHLDPQVGFPGNVETLFPFVGEAGRSAHGQENETQSRVGFAHDCTPPVSIRWPVAEGSLKKPWPAR